VNSEGGVHGSGDGLALELPVLPDLVPKVVHSVGRLRSLSRPCSERAVAAASRHTHTHTHTHLVRAGSRFLLASEHKGFGAREIGHNLSRALGLTQEPFADEDAGATLCHTLGA
jgi:hypothetical protein